MQSSTCGVQPFALFLHELRQPAPRAAAAADARGRYGEVARGRARGALMFLYDDVSPWGQGATVIHPHRCAVQKPPAVHTHCATAQPAASQRKKPTMEVKSTPWLPGCFSIQTMRNIQDVKIDFVPVFLMPIDSICVRNSP